MQIELNQNEAQVLLGLIDVAVKSGGLNIAQSSLVLAMKIKEASEADKKTLANKSANNTGAAHVQEAIDAGLIK